MTAATHDDAARELPVMDEAVPSWKLILTLIVAGMAAGLVVVLLWDWTRPRVERHNAAVLRGAIEEVLHAPARADTLWLVNGALTGKAPTGDAAKKVERVYLGYDQAGKPTGYALSVDEPGFSEMMHLLIGYVPATHTLLGMKVLDSKETPGIADKIVLPVFTGQFAGRTAPLEGIKESDRAKMETDKSAVVMVTGATISSRAVIRGIDKTIAHWQPYLDAYGKGALAAGGTR